eukprot:224412_1
MKRERALKVVALCNLIMVLKYFMTIIFQGIRRTRAPEDGFQPPVIADESKQPLNSGNDDDSGSKKVIFTEEQRWQRIVLNDLENVQMGIIMMWISLFVSGDNMVTAICALIFTLGRCIHTLCYVYKLMPWRAIAWLLGVLSTLTLAANIVYGAFKSNGLF